MYNYNSTPGWLPALFPTNSLTHSSLRIDLLLHEMENTRYAMENTHFSEAERMASAERLATHYSAQEGPRAAMLAAYFAAYRGDNGPTQALPNDMAARVTGAVSTAQILDGFGDVIANRSARRVRETETCGAPLRLETIGDFNDWQDRIHRGESVLETPDVDMNEEEAAFLASDDGGDYIHRAMVAIPPPPIHEEYHRVGSAAFLRRPRAEHRRLVRANEARRAAIIAHVLHARARARAQAASAAPAGETFLGVPPPNVLSAGPRGIQVITISLEDREFLRSRPGLDLIERILLESAGQIEPQAYGVTGSQQEKEDEVRRREIVLITRGISQRVRREEMLLVSRGNNRRAN